MAFQRLPVLRASAAGLGIAAVVFLLGGTERGGRAGPLEAETPEAVELVSSSTATAGPGPAAPAPADAPAGEPAAAVSQPAADTQTARIVVSITRRQLWLVKGRDILLSAPVAIGMNDGFTFEGRRYHFATPKGTRRVIAKQRDPVWTVPEWHYLEKATKRGLGVVRLEKDSKIELSDGSHVAVDGDQVGRINHFGHFAPFPPGVEIIFDDRIFVPPLTSAQRRVPDALGPYKLDTGDGYLIHGTHVYNEDSIGEAVSHGCVRMNNDDLERLYRLVPVGTVVEIV